MIYFSEDLEGETCRKSSWGWDRYGGQLQGRCWHMARRLFQLSMTRWLDVSSGFSDWSFRMPWPFQSFQPPNLTIPLLFQSFTFKSCQSCQSLKLIHVLIIVDPRSTHFCWRSRCSFVLTGDPLRYGLQPGAFCGAQGKAVAGRIGTVSTKAGGHIFGTKTARRLNTQTKKQQDSRWSLASTSWQIIPQRRWKHTLLWRQTCGNIKKVMKVNLELKASKGMVLL